MCGIAGFIDRTEPDAANSLRRMLGLIQHRGPDGEGMHVDASTGLALGMRRLSIIDLEGGWQPIWNEDGHIGIVFNGEIYNYRELRQDLEQRGHHFRTHSDTEVLVHLYEEHGPSLTQHLRGMFAFCIFDRHRHRLLLARDHFGQKPLYYSTLEGRFAFASELKCLFALPWVPRGLRRDAFLTFATWLSLPSGETHFQHIHKMHPGEVLDVPLPEPQGFKRVSAWAYDLRSEPDLCAEDTAIDALDTALAESVKLHLRADVPVGVLLSSGLDSRTVVTYAQAQQGQMQTFTVGFGAEDSELLGAAETAREIGSKHHSIELSAADFAASIERVAHLLDEPIGDPACFAVLAVCELARQHVKVLLSGEGSDELFAGYEGRYAGMLATLSRTDTLRKWGALLPGGCWASPSRLQRFLARAGSLVGEEIARLRIEGLPGDVTQPRGFTPAQLSQVQSQARALGSRLHAPQRDRLSELLCWDLRWQLAESLLQKADKMSMGASIELRTPLLDRGVASIAARIPSALKLPPGGPGKSILRKTLARKLQEDPRRPKKGFPVPLNAWLAGPLRDRVEAELFATHSAVMRELDPVPLRAAWADFVAGRWDGGRTFFSLWLYETWRCNLPRP